VENKRDLILLVETATELCSVALSSNGKVITQKVSREPRSHTSVLSVLTSRLLKDSNVKTNELDAVAVSEGPGSYTGLRVGLSFAKGLCYALSKPLISVGTLDTIASIALENDKVKELIDNLGADNVIIVPMIDARRMEVYTACFSGKGKIISQVEPLVVTQDSFDSLLANKTLLFCGDGSPKVSSLLLSPNAKFIEIELLAHGMAKMAYDKYIKKTFEDLAYFQPFYLKDFIAGKPKKDILRPTL